MISEVLVIQEYRGPHQGSIHVVDLIDHASTDNAYCCWARETHQHIYGELADNEILRASPDCWFSAPIGRVNRDNQTIHYVNGECNPICGMEKDENNTRTTMNWDVTTCKECFKKQEAPTPDQLRSLGWAVGEYTFHCRTCKTFHGLYDESAAKRSWSCYHCAVETWAKNRDAL